MDTPKWGPWCSPIHPPSAGNSAAGFVHDHFVGSWEEDLRVHFLRLGVRDELQDRPAYLVQVGRQLLFLASASGPKEAGASWVAGLAGCRMEAGD